MVSAGACVVCPQEGDCDTQVFSGFSLALHPCLPFFDTIYAIGVGRGMQPDQRAEQTSA